MDFSNLIASYRPTSAVEEDVYDTLHREHFTRHPLRHVADCIICRQPQDYIRDLLLEDDLVPQIDDSIHKGLRLLHYAAFLNDDAVLTLLLEMGANPNAMDETGYTPVHVCADRGLTDLLLLLVAYGARICFTELEVGDRVYGDPPRATPADEPLRLAIANEHHDTARALLEHGADPHATYFLGPEIALVSPGDPCSLGLLLEYGANPNARDTQGMTPLMKACRSVPESLEAVDILINYGAEVNAFSMEDGKTPLHYAVLVGNAGVVKRLVESGAKICFPAERTRPPPLFYAVLRGDSGLLEYLLDAGADVNAESMVVGSALHLALIESIDNQVQVVETLLRRGANPNAITVSEGRPVMKPPIGEYIQCCERQNVEILKLLLRYGARIVLQIQRNHHLGILKVMHRIHLGLRPEIMLLLMDAAESTDIEFVQQSKQMNQHHKDLLLERAGQPFSLLHASRLQFRKLGWGPRFLQYILSMELPSSLKKYLLFEES